MKMQAFHIAGSYMEQRGTPPGLASWVAAGSVGGMATTVIGCPSERIMVIAQIRKQGVFDVIRQTGMKGLYKGGMVTLYRDITFNAVFFATTELVAKQWSARTGKKCTAWERFLAGLGAGEKLSGCAYVCVCHINQPCGVKQRYFNSPVLSFCIVGCT